MNKIILNFLFLGLSIGAIAQDATETFDSFTKVVAATSVNVELIKSNQQKAEIWVQEGDIEDLKIEQFGNRIKIRWEERGKVWRGSNWNRKASIKLYYKELNSIAASAGAKIIGDNLIKSSDMEIRASSGGRVEVQVDAGTIDVDVSSGGSAEVDGSSERLVVQASSGGTFRGSDLEASDVKASASSGGNARVWATESIRASASSGGNVKYRGNPSKKDISSSKWSGGSVRSI